MKNATFYAFLFLLLLFAAQVFYFQFIYICRIFKPPDLSVHLNPSFMTSKKVQNIEDSIQETSQKKEHCAQLKPLNCASPKSHTPYLPHTASPEHFLSIIVPLRNREVHLELFAAHMKSFLEGLPHEIIVIDQVDQKPMNRGALRNVGAREASKKADYFVFQDVDLLPLSGVDYGYAKEGFVHLSSEMSHFEWHAAYDWNCGGVVMLHRSAFERINGYSNQYWGWGAEDDDLCKRVKGKKIVPDGIIPPRPPLGKGRFVHIFDLHEKRNNSNSHQNQKRYDQLHGAESFYAEGLSTVAYKVASSTVHPLGYTYKKIEFLMDVPEAGSSSSFSDFFFPLLLIFVGFFLCFFTLKLVRTKYRSRNE